MLVIQMDRQDIVTFCEGSLRRNLHLGLATQPEVGVK